MPPFFCQFCVKMPEINRHTLRSWSRPSVVGWHEVNKNGSNVNSILLHYFGILTQEERGKIIHCEMLPEYVVILQKIVFTRLIGDDNAHFFVWRFGLSILSCKLCAPRCNRYRWMGLMVPKERWTTLDTDKILLVFQSPDCLFLLRLKITY